MNSEEEIPRNSPASSMQSVQSALIQNLSPKNCSDVLCLSRAYELTEAYDEAYGVLISQFQTAAQSP